MLAYTHSAFRKNGKVDPLLTAAVVVFALLIVYGIGLAFYELYLDHQAPKLAP